MQSCRISSSSGSGIIFKILFCDCKNVSGGFLLIFDIYGLLLLICSWTTIVYKVRRFTLTLPHLQVAFIVNNLEPDPLTILQTTRAQDRAPLVITARSVTPYPSLPTRHSYLVQWAGSVLLATTALNRLR